jgi:hypothetical protein
MQKGVTETHRYMQLAVTKDGVIGGTYFNETTNTSRPLQGTVDKKTQRAAWTFADGKNTDTIAETGIYNFTKDTTPVLVHFGADKTEQIDLMRVEAPKGDAGAAVDKVMAKPDPDTEARRWYSLAKNYKTVGRKDKMLEYVSKIIAKHSQSEWADKARKLMVDP